jgi:hypothetical protein
VICTSNNNETGKDIELNIDEVKRKQRAKKEPQNPIVDERLHGGDKIQQIDIEKEVSYPFTDVTKQKNRPKRAPSRTLPWETETKTE